jgi:protein-L-isoaspartate O-methyltransferase
MGANVSNGKNNDELVDNLVVEGVINDNLIERIFRTVDRGIFFLDDVRRTLAYKDQAWRSDNYHISAPNVYAKIIESLELKSGHSFLNIGSGTGYLSCLVGLLLGQNGINHNIEIHKDLVDYSRRKVAEFIATSFHFDQFDFCPPRFIQGNCLNINISNDMFLYDRVYVAAGINDEANKDKIELFFKSFVKINGILIMPVDDMVTNMIN